MKAEARARQAIARERAQWVARLADLELEAAAAAIASVAARGWEGDLWERYERRRTRAAYDRWLSAMDKADVACADELRLSADRRRLRDQLERLEQPGELRRRTETFERLDALRARSEVSA